MKVMQGFFVLVYFDKTGECARESQWYSGQNNNDHFLLPWEYLDSDFKTKTKIVIIINKVCISPFLSSFESLPADGGDGTVVCRITLLVPVRS